jgi:hypothetical protein
MGTWTIYSWGDRVLIPAVNRTAAGFYLEADPIGDVGKTEVDKLGSELAARMRTGNPSVATPTRAEYSTPAIVRHVKARSWSAFERRCKAWSIDHTERGYLLRREVGRSSERGLYPEPTPLATWPAETDIAIVAHDVALLIVRALKSE